MEKLKESHGVAVRWRSFELRPKGAPPISPEYQARILAARPRFEAMAREQYGLELNVGPFGIDSRPALVGAKYAEEMGVGAAYHDAVFRAYWQQGRSIEDVAVLTEIAEQVGLAREPFLAALVAGGVWETAVTADIDQAFQYGLSGVPALVFANKYLVSGAQPYDVLTQVVDQIVAEQGAA